MHVALGKLTSGPNDTTLDHRDSEATECHGRDCDVEVVVQADLARDVDEVHDGDKEGEDEGVGLVGVDDDEEEAY